MQNASLKVCMKAQNSRAAYTRIAFLNKWTFDVIFASIQLSQEL